MTINIKTEEHIMLIEIDRPKKIQRHDARDVYADGRRPYYQTGSDGKFMWESLRHGPHFNRDWS